MSRCRAVGCNAETERQKPIAGDELAETVASMLAIVMHPAVRLGFLDALSGAPLDHDRIGDRIQAETPRGALRRTGWSDRFLMAGEIEIAQYRYEEGRLLVVQEGLRCKAWGHPDFPPAQVRAFIQAEAKRRAAEGHRGEAGNG